MVAARPTRAKQTLPWTLQARLTLVLSLSVLAAGVALFVLIDRLVARQYALQAAQYRTQTVTNVERLLERELGHLRSLAQVAAADSDLVNATFYHLHLDGERGHPRAALDRLASSLKLEAAGLWSPRGDAIVSIPVAMQWSDGAAVHASASPAVFWVDGDAWLAVDAELRREQRVIARLWVARRLAPMLQANLPAEVKARILQGPPADTVSADPSAAENLASLALAGGQDLRVRLDLSDPTTAALADVKGLLALSIPVFALMAILAVRAVLRRELAPLEHLAESAAAAGRGDWDQRIRAERGSAEMRSLVLAFERMLSGLRRMHALEQQVQRDQRLSAIGRMAARVAHDINNPLTVIHNVACLLQRNPKANELIGEDIALLRHHSERCQRTTELLLQFGRPIRLRAENLPLVETVRTIAARWAGGEGRCAVHVEAAVGAPDSVRIDPFQIEVLLDNLLDNACAAGNGQAVTVAMGNDDSSFSVAVRDRGPGFTAAAREHLFEPFFTTRPGGTGLGLSNALMIARAHGGDLEIGPGPGGEMVLRLPRAHHADDADHARDGAPGAG